MSETLGRKVLKGKGESHSEPEALLARRGAVCRASTPRKARAAAAQLPLPHTGQGAKSPRVLTAPSGRPRARAGRPAAGLVSASTHAPFTCAL